MYNKDKILRKVDILYNKWKEGSLGGEVMPEDANPHLEKSSLENYLYFTLPMALNYQRNSYKLWESALNTYNDEETNFVFNPKICLEKTFEDVQYALVKYKIALQKQKQTEIWLSLCKTFVELYDGDIRKLFDSLDNDINEIKNFIQKENKKEILERESEKEKRKRTLKTKCTRGIIYFIGLIVLALGIVLNTKTLIS